MAAASAVRRIGREPTDISPDYVFQSKGQLTDFGYVVEVSIPFKSLQFSDAPSQSWGLNIIRKVQSRGEEHSWAPAKRAAASYIAQFGKLTNLESLDRGLVLDVTPILTARADGSREDDGRWDYASGNPQLGANVRWGLTSNLTLNGTVRPDFAEVESDAGQVTTRSAADAVLSGEAAVLSRRRRAVLDAGWADLHAANREPARRGEDHGHARRHVGRGARRLGCAEHVAFGRGPAALHVAAAAANVRRRRLARRNGLHGA